MTRTDAVRVAAVCILVVTASSANAIEGRVLTTGDEPVAGAFVSLLDASHAMAGYDVTDANGRFRIDEAQPREAGFLAVAPPNSRRAGRYEVPALQPRVFRLAGEQSATVRLPRCAVLVLEARDLDGTLLRWAGWEARGTFGGAFVYATDLDDDACIPAVVWWAHDRPGNEAGGSRDTGVPMLALPETGRCAIQPLFWRTRDYGTLLLRADNAGEGFPATADTARSLDLNLELARTAVHDLARRYDTFPALTGLDVAELRQRVTAAETVQDPPERARLADDVLADALRLRDRFELDRARRAIDRRGPRDDFRFGVFEGGPFRRAPYAKAREAGFDLATVLPAWGWTDATTNALRRTTGVAPLHELGYEVKVHGAVWMQSYGILPPDALGMPAGEVMRGALEHQRRLMEALGPNVSLWEAVNEPNATNVVGLSRGQMLDLTHEAASNIQHATDAPALVNGSHETDYGRCWQLYDLDGVPHRPFPRTWSAFLREADAAGALADVDLIGLQFYPGFVFNERLGGHAGPAYTLGWFVDLLERYRRFGRPLHVTEFSVPSAVPPDVSPGTWRDGWSEETQADYAEAVFTIVYATPWAESVTYWDLTDANASVVNGGLLRADGSTKPAFTRLETLLQSWGRGGEETAP